MSLSWRYFHTFMPRIYYRTVRHRPIPYVPEWTVSSYLYATYLLQTCSTQTCSICPRVDGILIPLCHVFTTDLLDIEFGANFQNLSEENLLSMNFFMILIACLLHFLINYVHIFNCSLMRIVIAHDGWPNSHWPRLRLLTKQTLSTTKWLFIKQIWAFANRRLSKQKLVTPSRLLTKQTLATSKSQFIKQQFAYTNRRLSKQKCNWYSDFFILI